MKSQSRRNNAWCFLYMSENPTFSGVFAIAHYERQASITCNIKIYFFTPP